MILDPFRRPLGMHELYFLLNLDEIWRENFWVSEKKMSSSFLKETDPVDTKFWEILKFASLKTYFNGISPVGVILIKKKPI